MPALCIYSLTAGVPLRVALFLLAPRAAAGRGRGARARGGRCQAIQINKSVLRETSSDRCGVS